MATSPGTYTIKTPPRLNMHVTAYIRFSRWVRFRYWLGAQLIRLACVVMNCHVVFEDSA